MSSDMQEQDITDLYQQLPKETPGKSLDQAILSMAQQQATETRRRRKFALRWPISIAASVLFVSVLYLDLAVVPELFGKRDTSVQSDQDVTVTTPSPADTEAFAYQESLSELAELADHSVSIEQTKRERQPEQVADEAEIARVMAEKVAQDAKRAEQSLEQRRMAQQAVELAQEQTAARRSSLAPQQAASPPLEPAKIEKELEMVQVTGARTTAQTVETTVDPRIAHLLKLAERLDQLLDQQQPDEQAINATQTALFEQLETSKLAHPELEIPESWIALLTEQQADILAPEE